MRGIIAQHARARLTAKTLLQGICRSTTDETMQRKPGEKPVSRVADQRLVAVVSDLSVHHVHGAA